MMKKLFIPLMILALIGTAALAETTDIETLPITPDDGDAAVEAPAQTLPTGEFALLSERAPYDPNAPAEGPFFCGQIDLNGDGALEEICYSYSEQDYIYSYRLTVNGMEAGRDDAFYLTGELGAVRFAGVEGAFLLVADNGASEDPTSYIYHYVSGETGASLDFLGTVDAFASDMTVTGRNTFATYVRAGTLFTWYRPADFVIGTGYHWDDEGNLAMSYGVAEVPRDLYSVGAHVTLKVDLPLMTSRTEETVCRTLRAGEEAVVAATDDREWYYISAPTEDYETSEGGWFRLSEDGFGVLINGAEMGGWDVFDGLLYAD